MRELIRRVLFELEEDKNIVRIKNAYESIKNVLEKNYPFLKVYTDLNSSNSEGKILIDVINNDQDYSKITDLINQKIYNLGSIHPIINDYSLYNKYFRWDFHPNTYKKFYQTDFIQHWKNKLDKLGIDYKDYIISFRGGTHPGLLSRIRELNAITSDEVETQITKYLNSLTDVPLKINYDRSQRNLNIQIIPQITVQDFLECKFKKWDLPISPHNLSNMIRSNLLSVSYEWNIIPSTEIKWPRDILSFVTKKNEELRQQLPNDIKNILGVRIDYQICSNSPIISVGDSPEQKVDKRVDGRRIRFSAKSIGIIDPKIQYIENGYWFTKNAYNPENKENWSKEELYEFFVTESKKKHGDVYEYSFENFTDLNTNTSVFCKKHNTWFDVNPKLHIKGKKCPFDVESSGEKLVRVYLESKNVKFLQYYRLEKCVSEINGKCYKLPFDFYLPDLNILIEYDGEQHFRPVTIWGGEESFVRQQKLDKIKTKFAQDNNIKLVRIPYTVKKIEQLMDYLPDDVIIPTKK